MLHIRLSAILAILYSLVRHLQFSQMHVSLHSNHIFDPFLLLFDIVELASVPLLDTVSVALNVVRGSRPHIIEEAAI